MRDKFPWYGWAGLSLGGIFWALNWGLSGPRTHWGFFPMWLGYCLVIDALVVHRTGTSLLKRSWRKYFSLFLLSAPVWWLFELLNLRTQNWIYQGLDGFSVLQNFFWTTISFTTVMPAVFGSAELAASFDFLKRPVRGPNIRADKPTTLVFFAAGWIMLGVMLAWPKLFFPFLWLSLFFIIEPINIWLGKRSLTEWTGRGDWRPVLALWVGVLLTAFFWEMWNFHSFPKWIYQVPWGGGLKIFEMPALGYGGYLPFALELYAIRHLFQRRQTQPDQAYIHLGVIE